MDQIPAKGSRFRLSSVPIAVVYAAFLIFLIAAVYRQGWSHYYAAAALRSGVQADLATAVGYEPHNPYAYRTEAEVRMHDKDYRGAIAAVEKAIALRGHDYLLWLQLGFARQQLAEFGAAAEAYRRSIELAPNYSRPHYYMGMLLLDADRDEEAFRYLTKAAELDPELASSVRQLARRNFDDPRAIEAALDPVTPDAKRSVARYLIKYNYMTDSIRSFLLSNGLTAAQKNEFSRYLLHKENYELARAVWLSRPGQEVSASEAPIFDGGFERITESDPSGLGWQIEQNMSAVAVFRDDENTHTGDSALTVRFAGGVDLNRPIIHQLAFVTPGRTHKLVFFYRSVAIVSAGPPTVTVSGPNSTEILAASELRADTNGNWVRHELTFTPSATVPILIALRRTACTNPCPIFGELSLDDFSIQDSSMSKVN